MESLGEKLRSARENKGCGYDQASRDTNIAVRYLEALENENFAMFPGDAYLLGFLRNYSDYLGLDTQEVLNLYRALKIQEQPIPVEQLLRGPSQLPKILRFLAILVLVLGAITAAVYFIGKLPRAEAAPALEVEAPVSVVMDSPILERRFYQGDTVIVPLDDAQYKLELSHLGETVTISTPSGTVSLELSEEVPVDLDKNGIIDVYITVEDFVKNAPSTGALLRFDIENTLSSAYDAEAPSEAALMGSATVPPVYYATSPNPYPFTLQAAFQGYCMFRYEILAERSRANRNEQYFQKGDEFNIETIQNGVRMWVSNATAIKIRLMGNGRELPVELGNAGEVIVADIRWVRDEEGRYRLGQFRLE
ncbi:MAG: helix-turn-helix domain-containing protein [Treponema sp.]|nr:helix-turn-helix domain-containing protein [Treponema sp.]